MNVTLKVMLISELIVRKYGNITKFANAVGISRQAISMRLATGRCRFESAVKIADALGAPVQDIVNEKIDQ